MPDPLISRRLGRYEIQQEIGRGGMARVYRATDTLLKRTVALKVLAPQLGDDPEFARRFEREAVTAANLRHPAIITIFDVGEAEGLRYIAMEYVGGVSLSAALAEHGALPLPLVVAVLQPVADALDTAHRLGAVHRDVKPQNIMVDTDGRVLLTDFGIAQGPQQGGERLTRAGAFMGTPEYLAPEQVQGQLVTGASDRYALGVVAFELLTGRAPFEGSTPQLIMAHAYTAPPPITSIAPALPPELDAIFARALAKDPAARYDQATAFVKALQAVATQRGLPGATGKAVAALTGPGASSAGQPTIMITSPAGDAGQSPPARTPPASPIEDIFGQQQPAPPSNAAASPIEKIFDPPPQAQTPRHDAAAQPTVPTPAARPQTPPARRQTPPPTPPRTPPASRQQARPSTPRDLVYPRGDDEGFVAPRERSRSIYSAEPRPPMSLPLIVIGVVIVILIVLLVLESASRNRRTAANGGLGAVFAGATATPTSPALPSATPVAGEPPTPVPTVAAPAPPDGTASPALEPTAPPTEAPIVVPTTQPAPSAEPTTEPTATLEPTPTAVPPTDTPEPTATPAPTDTPVTPTSTPFGAPTAVGDGATIVVAIDDGLDLFDTVAGRETSIRADAQPVGPAAISPDGATVLFDALANGQRQIYQWTRSSNRIDQYMQVSGNAYHPAWSPDGTRVVYAGDSEGDADIYVVDGDGIRPVVNGPAQDEYPSWTPDGAQIVWESQRNDQWGIYLLNIATGEQRQVVAPVAGANDRYPRVSPDGTQVVFASNRGGEGYDLYVQSLAGGSPVRVTDLGSGDAGGPQWSPDGNLILFFSDASGTNDIYAVRLLGDGALIPIRATPADERWPIWGK